ncbi:unnamed protein product [marine sediment metagenome]|uniref:Uncharacterized protein n=1 Tax=marine sediment metagenome TaxID=412755 RepID=X1U4V6_9ZZZZ
MEVGTAKEVDLEASAKADLQTALTAEQSWFALGFQTPADEGTNVYHMSYFYSEEATSPKPKPPITTAGEIRFSSSAILFYFCPPCTAFFPLGKSYYAGYNASYKQDSPSNDRQASYRWCHLL